MNPNLFFDAMDYIDEDMLEEVNVLRTQKEPIRNLMWIRWASMAACLCIVAGGIWIVSRTGLLDNAERENAADMELSDGQSLVHSYISVSVKTNGDSEKTVTDIQSVTAIYDVLQSFYKDNASLLYSENAKAEDMAENEGIRQESVMDNTASVRYEISLVSADGTETVYRVEDNMAENRTTGERVVLTAQQLEELKDVLNVK